MSLSKQKRNPRGILNLDQGVRRVEIVRNTQIEAKKLFEVRKKKEVLQRERNQETKKKIGHQKEKAARAKRRIKKKRKNEIFVG